MAHKKYAEIMAHFARTSTGIDRDRILTKEAIDFWFGNPVMVKLAED